VPNGYESFSELGRAFDRFVREDFGDFRDETRDELKFLRRLLFTVLGSAILAGLISSTLIAVRGG
jgi:hypothetical protein